MKSLKSLLKESKYKPSIRNLEEILRDENKVLDLLADLDIKDSFIMEATIIAFLTTASGLSLLRYYSKNYDSFKHYKDSKNSIYHRMPVFASKWEINDFKYIKFLRYLMSNRSHKIFEKCDTVIDFTLNKMRFSFLINDTSDYYMPMSVYSSQYNFVFDYLHVIYPRVESLVLMSINKDTDYDDINNSLLNKLLKSYKRSFDIIYHYKWYQPMDYTRNADYMSIVPTFLKLITRSDAKIVGFINEIINIGMATKYDYQNNSYSLQPWNHNVSESGSTALSSIPEDENDISQVLTFNLNSDGTTTEFIESSDSMHENLRKQEILFKVLFCSNTNHLCHKFSPFISIQFHYMCALVDPWTQPIPNDKHIISIDLLYNMFLGLMVPHIKNFVNEDDGMDWRFQLCSNMQEILTAITLRLNCFDYDKFDEVDFSDDWESELQIWIPSGLHTQNLELLYMNCIFAVYTIYKIYSDKPIHFNPFLSQLISLWKKLTCVLLIALKVDRCEEENETYNTPLIVRATIRGASALRAVIATILNGQMEVKRHDFAHEPINTFMSPHGRKLCDGALFTEPEAFLGAIVALGNEINEWLVVEYQFPIEDQIDEDVKYIFEYELDGFNELDYPNSGEALSIDEIQADIDIYQKRCKCIFSDDNLLENGDYEDEDLDEDEKETIAEVSQSTGSDENDQHPSQPSNNQALGKQQAVRSKTSIEFDYGGKDWRDVPRGLNLYYSPTYIFTDKPLLNVVFKLTLKATSEVLTKEETNSLLRYVASCVKNEQDMIILPGFNEKEIDVSKEDAVTLVKPDDIYEIWCEESAFERMIIINPDLAWRLMDEMLMCSGFRRVLIWFITRMELSHSMIYYIFELLMGNRGEYSGAHDNDVENHFSKDKNAKEASYSAFSRQGKIILSDIEFKMVLKEFFTNAAIFFSEKAGPWQDTEDTTTTDSNIDKGYSLHSIGLMKLVSMMVLSLLDSDNFDINESDCTFELQSLLMDWITIIPEAKDLYFKIKASVKSFGESEKFDNDGMIKHAKDLIKVPVDKNSKSYNYNKQLLMMFPPIIEGNLESKKLKELKEFLENYSFESECPVIGRKVIFTSDEILPLPDNVKPLSFLDELMKYEKRYGIET